MKICQRKKHTKDMDGFFWWSLYEAKEIFDVTDETFCGENSGVKSTRPCL